MARRHRKPEVPQLVPQQAPPPDYYADNVAYLLREVRERHRALLGPMERDLIAAFEAASVPARRLFARLLSRSGPWLRVDALNYAEVPDRHAALAELAELGLVDLCPVAPAAPLLGLLTRAEQARLFPRIKARTKPEWTTACLATYPDPLIRARMAPDYPWVGLRAHDPFRVCRVLFFGGDHQDLTTFVMQDLGVHRFERYPLDATTRAFPDPEALARYLRCRRLSLWSKALDDYPALAPALPRLLTPAPMSRPEQRARDKVLNRIGRWHERRGELAEALECYELANSHPARERRARILRKLGDEIGVCQLLAAMRSDPWAPEEEDFAVRFAEPGRRRGGADLPITERHLDGPTPEYIEGHALELLTAEGGQGWHLENLLALGLAGLAYWDEIFAPVPGAFSHAFQFAPQDLFWPDFARVRRGALQAKAASLHEPGGLAGSLRRTHAAKHGIANRLVHWQAFTGEVLEALLANVPHQVLANLATHTIFNLHRCRAGFPDLLIIYGPGDWELVEVKGPTDQLQPNQRVRFQELAALSVPARVLKFKAPC